MKLIFIVGIFILMMQGCFAPPVTKTKGDHDETSKNEVENNVESEYDLHYQRYLNEVVQALENDPEFRKKLEKAPKEDFSTGKIAHELEYVNHNVRRKLDEIKREELERLRRLATREYELENNLDPTRSDFADHLDHQNPHKFEIEDLKKLIHKATADLAEVDKKRREEFKQYEMEKKFEEELKLQEMTEEQRKKYQEELEQEKEQRKKHEPLHHPGSQRQLEEVWENQDHMTGQEFDPRAFFQVHDIDGNGHWDQYEVKVFFRKELDKIYAQGRSDVRERAEEMERMRETFFNEADSDKDGLISYNEFLESTKKEEYKRDPEWKPLNEQEFYTPEEFDNFHKQREEQIRQMIADGLLPPHPSFGHDGQIPAQGGEHYGGQVPVGNQQLHGQVPQYQPQHQDLNQQYQQQHPQQYQGQQYQQVPGQHQQYQQQVPVQQYQNQIPQHAGQGNIHQQVPQHQVPQHQVPQHQVPQHQVPQQNIPQHQVPSQNTHQQGIPVQNIPQQVHQGQPGVQQNNQVPVVQQQHQAPVAQQHPQGQHQQVVNEKQEIITNEVKP